MAVNNLSMTKCETLAVFELKRDNERTFEFSHLQNRICILILEFNFIFFKFIHIFT